MLTRSFEEGYAFHDPEKRKVASISTFLFFSFLFVLIAVDNVIMKGGVYLEQ